MELQGEYQSIQEDELGCRILQSVLIGAIVQPVYVYNPNKIVNSKTNAVTETELNSTYEFNQT